MQGFVVDFFKNVIKKENAEKAWESMLSWFTVNTDTDQRRLYTYYKGKTKKNNNQKQLFATMKQVPNYFVYLLPRNPFSYIQQYTMYHRIKPSFVEQ